MTQGAPVLAGMNNDARKMTTINMIGPDFIGLTVNATSPLGAVNQAWAGIQAGAFNPGAVGTYTIARGRGVYAVGLDGEGVFAHSWSTNGVTASTSASNASAINGKHPTTGDGVRGESAGGGIGVHGMTSGGSPEGQAPAGVLGECIGPFDGDGVRGTADQGVGVRGQTAGGLGGIGVLGESTSNDPTSVGVAAFGNFGIGLVAAGAQAPIQLTPNLTIKGPPTTGTHNMGEMMIDRVGDLYLCKADGTPGTWVKVA